MVNIKYVSDRFGERRTVNNPQPTRGGLFRFNSNSPRTSSVENNRTRLNRSEEIVNNFVVPSIDECVSIKKNPYLNPIDYSIKGVTFPKKFFKKFCKGY